MQHLYGPVGQRAVADVDDVLCYATTILEDVEVTGSISVTLFVSSPEADIDFTAGPDRTRGAIAQEPEDQMIPAVNHIHQGLDYPSRVVLPIIERSEKP